MRIQSRMRLATIATVAEIGSMCGSFEKVCQKYRELRPAFYRAMRSFVSHHALYTWVHWGVRAGRIGVNMQAPRIGGPIVDDD
jgi:hypothetical protein